MRCVVMLLTLALGAGPRPLVAGETPRESPAPVMDAVDYPDFYMTWEPCVPSRSLDKSPTCDPDERSVRIYGWIVPHSPIARVSLATFEIGIKQANGDSLSDWWNVAYDGCYTGRLSLVIPRLAACPSFWSGPLFSGLEYARHSADVLIVTGSIYASEADSVHAPAGEARLLFALDIPFTLTSSCPGCRYPACVFFLDGALYTDGVRGSFVDRSVGWLGWQGAFVSVRRLTTTSIGLLDCVGFSPTHAGTSSWGSLKIVYR